MRPLSAKEVYAVLRKAGREDAVPEGRVVTQGISAITGFALGVAKGIGGALLYDVATSNATTEWINSLNLTASLPSIDLAALMPTINLTGFGDIDYAALLGNHSFTLPTLNLTALFGSKGGTSSNTTATATATPATAQEICFKSRSMNYDEWQGRQATTTTGTAGTTPTTATTGTGTDGLNTSTNSGTTTSDAGASFGTTCIVIQKASPRRRKRRSIIRKRQREHLNSKFY